MDNQQTKTTKPRALVITKFNYLSLNIVKRFVDLSCEVDVVTDNIDLWNIIVDETKFDGWRLMDIEKFSYQDKYDYFIYIDLEQFGNTSRVKLSDLAQLVIKHQDLKKVFVFSYIASKEKHIDNNNLLLKINLDKPKYRALYLGDVVELKKGFVKNTVAEKLYFEEDLPCINNWKFLPIGIADALYHVERSIFSFMSESTKHAVISHVNYANEFQQTVNKNLTSRNDSINISFEDAFVEEKAFVQFDKNVLMSFLEEYLIRVKSEKENANTHRYKAVVVTHNDDAEKTSSNPNDTLVNRSTQKDLVPPQHTPLYSNEQDSSKVVNRNTNEIESNKIIDQQTSNKGSKIVHSLTPAINDKKQSRKVLLALKKYYLVIKKRVKKPVLYVVFFAVLGYFIVPLFLITTSIFLVSFNKNRLLSYDLKTARTTVGVSNRVVALTENYIFILSTTPHIGSIFGDLHALTLVLLRVSTVEEKIVVSLSATNVLVDNAFGVDGSVEDITSSILLVNKSLVEELGFLEGQIKALSGNNKKVILNIISSVDISRTKSLAYFIQQISADLPNMLGEDKTKSYALVFQDENVIRPSGGIANYIAIIVFSEGKLADIYVYTPEFLDKQIKGEIIPPANLLSGLNTDKWSSKDFGWHVNYINSAEQLKWFISKSVDIEVDGVVVLNQEIINRLEENMANEYKKVFNDELSTSDLHTAVAEKQQDPKLVKEYIKRIFETLVELDENQKLSIYGLVFEGSNNKNIQLMTTDDNFNNKLQSANLFGNKNSQKCSFNCFSDEIGVFDSSVNANAQSIKREINLTVYIEEGIVKHSMQYVFTNPKDNSQPYQAYVKILVNKESGFEDIYRTNESGTVLVKPDISVEKEGKTAGFIIEIMPGQTERYLINWETTSVLDLTRDGEYDIRFIKQSGMKNVPLSVSIKTPERLTIFPTNIFRLTNEGLYGYNTTLDKDINLKVNLKYD
ncbi:DUF4012 domain-containing protein [Candidatus Woesebacteria bacterium]|nr:MAG: DUF4012 domain-containing protein [Candidatus Woesebacteria bacterium]